MLTYYADEITDPEAVINDGDTVNIDYVGYVDGVQFGELTLVKALQVTLHLFLKQNLIRGVVEDFSGTGDTVLAQINVGHCEEPSFLNMLWQTPGSGRLSFSTFDNTR